MGEVTAERLKVSEEVLLNHHFAAIELWSAVAVIRDILRGLPKVDDFAVGSRLVHRMESIERAVGRAQKGIEKLAPLRAAAGLDRPPSAAVAPITVRGRPIADAAALWAALHPNQRAAIGVAAIDYHLGRTLADNAPDGRARLEADAVDLRTQEILVSVLDVVLDFGNRWMFDAIPLPSCEADVRRCRICGCTDDLACDGGCGLIEPDLCSACAPEGAG